MKRLLILLNREVSVEVTKLIVRQQEKINELLSRIEKLEEKNNESL